MQLCTLHASCICVVSAVSHLHLALRLAALLLLLWLLHLLPLCWLLRLLRCCPLLCRRPVLSAGSSLLDGERLQQSEMWAFAACSSVPAQQACCVLSNGACTKPYRHAWWSSSTAAHTVQSMLASIKCCLSLIAGEGSTAELAGLQWQYVHVAGPGTLSVPAVAEIL